jgi:hypothetical protein
MQTWKEEPQKLAQDRIKKFRGMGQASLAHAPISAGN